MHNPYEALGGAVALGVLLFWLGWLAKYGWDTRPGGARAQIVADVWDAGREAGYREQAMTAYEPEPDEPDGTEGDDWSGTLAAIPSVPAHEPEAAREPTAETMAAELMAPHPTAHGMALKARAGAELRAWEVTGEGLAELPAVLAGPGDDACPRCGRNRWHTLIKGQRWQCRNCGHVREAAPDGQAGNSSDDHPERPGGAAGGSPDDGRIGDPGPDHGAGVAGGSPTAWLLADWDSRAERRVTIADQRAAAEFAVWETELGGAITSAYEWLGEPVPPRGHVRQLEVHHG